MILIFSVEYLLFDDDDDNDSALRSVVVFVCIENEKCSMCVIDVCLRLVACGVWDYVSVYVVLLLKTHRNVSVCTCV